MLETVQESSISELLERWVSSGKHRELSFADWLKTLSYL